VTGAGRSVAVSLGLTEIGVRGSNGQEGRGLAEVKSQEM
jgi:hypothetical protein